MAEDRGEAIMLRLLAILEGLPGVDEVKRDEVLEDDAEGRIKRITLLEGTEAGSEELRPLPAEASQVMYRRPQIVLQNFDKRPVLGPGLATMRGLVIKAVTTDATLKGLTHRGLGGRYRGFESDLQFGHMMNGQLALNYEFPYVLRLYQF